MKSKKMARIAWILLGYCSIITNNGTRESISTDTGVDAGPAVGDRWPPHHLDGTGPRDSPRSGIIRRVCASGPASSGASRMAGSLAKGVVCPFLGCAGRFASPVGWASAHADSFCEGAFHRIGTGMGRGPSYNHRSFGGRRRKAEAPSIKFQTMPNDRRTGIQNRTSPAEGAFGTLAF
jgi:hypothetical protein